jgi:hypothetical protein
MGKNQKLIMIYDSQFQKILKIVNSCKTYEQLLVSKNLFENFKQKWIKQIPKMEFINYMYRFQSTYDLKRIRI